MYYINQRKKIKLRARIQKIKRGGKKRPQNLNKNINNKGNNRDKKKSKQGEKIKNKKQKKKKTNFFLRN